VAPELDFVNLGFEILSALRIATLAKDIAYHLPLFLYLWFGSVADCS
jgi:hypothetical protein